MAEDRPFDGVTVVELGQFVAVPYAAQMLADGGARVIKVEPPEGEATRHLAPLVPGESRHFVLRNRGKHVLPLDLKHPDAREILAAAWVDLPRLETFRHLGEGTRRTMRLLVSDLSVASEPDGGGRTSRIVARFVLPKGGYATTVLGRVFRLDERRTGDSKQISPPVDDDLEPA